MRIAAIYDIHANLPALKAVLQEIRQAGLDGVVVASAWKPRLKRSHIRQILGLPESNKV